MIITSICVAPSIYLPSISIHQQLIKYHELLPKSLWHLQQMPVCWPSRVVKYILQCHPLQFFIQIQCPFPPLDPGTALRHGCEQEEGASINAFPNPLHLLGPFLFQGQREFTKEAEMLLLTSCQVVSDSPTAAIQMPLLWETPVTLCQALGRPPSCTATSHSKSAPVDLSQSPSASTLT